MYYISNQLETSTVLSNMLLQFKILNCLIRNDQNSVMFDSFGSTKYFKLDTLEQNRNILEFSMILQNDLHLIHLQRQELWSF